MSETGKQLKLKMRCPKIGVEGQHFTGTGDLLSAMLLAAMDKYPDDFAAAVETAVNIVRGVLNQSVNEPIQGTNEISIIASKGVIEHPKIEINAEII